MRWKSHVRFGGRTGETDLPRCRHRALVRSHWATEALDEVRREEWNRLRRTGGARAAKEFKGLRWMLLRNWENLSPRQKGTIRDLERANKRSFRAWQLKEELRDIMSMSP